jgi:hypothetical protein
MERNVLLAREITVAWLDFLNVCSGPGLQGRLVLVWAVAFSYVWMRGMLFQLCVLYQCFWIWGFASLVTVIFVFGVRPRLSEWDLVCRHDNVSFRVSVVDGNQILTF